ncbi:VOC family protein [Burkholderia vietnamiensis]|uniref:VOC family protein n=1 Tax=Burkholderia vietnamiensis TaxID=60552 RepID=UPI000759B811|nr:VOC family protein [Burkholderia vietnamiensis]KVE74510.1 glyoxalase [Burkholderia vietnamiensis]
MATSVKPIPEGMRTLTPHLICAGATAAIEFYKRAFNATERFRLMLPDGRLAHSCLAIGDSALMLVDEMPEHGAVGPKALKGTPVSLHLFVPNVDAAIEQAVAAGAILRVPAADMFWGDRYGQVEDPFGHRWSIATHQRDLTPEQIAEAMASAPPCGS